jgi:hypothetical protein
MKIKTIIKLADVLDDSRRMPCDMYKLDESSYMSESRGDAIPIADMDIVYLVRAFKKSIAKDVSHVSDADLIKQNNDLIAANKTLARLHDAWKEKAMNMVEKSTYKEDLKKTDDIVENNDKIYKKNLQEQEDKVLALSSKITNLLSIIEEKDELLDKQTSHTEYWRDTYYKSSSVKGEVKMFSEIPNDTDGKAFVAQLKQYLNKESYKIRVRGQYLNDKTKDTEGWRRYEMGQPIDKSKCLRVYVDTK